MIESLIDRVTTLWHRLIEAATTASTRRRLIRAGLLGQVRPATIAVLRLAGAAIGLVVAVTVVMPGLPPRLSVLALPLTVAAAALTPDLVLEHRARRRTAQIAAALPDFLDLLATGAAAGRSLPEIVAEVGDQGRGPLAGELAVAAVEFELGLSPSQVWLGLRERLGSRRSGAFVAAIERSRRYGSPLGEGLHRQASGLRGRLRLRIGDRAARAAPKMQLVVAMILVPSVLLLVAAAIIANADKLLPFV